MLFSVIDSFILNDQGMNCPLLLLTDSVIFHRARFLLTNLPTCRATSRYKHIDKSLYTIHKLIMQGFIHIERSQNACVEKLRKTGQYTFRGLKVPCFSFNFFQYMYLYIKFIFRINFFKNM